MSITEYGLGSEPSICEDVYSFGILLMEIFTRKMTSSKESWSHNFLKAVRPKSVMEILDHVLQEIGREEMNANDHTHHLIRMSKGKVIWSLISILGSALPCAAELTSNCSDMSDCKAIFNKKQAPLDSLTTKANPDRYFPGAKVISLCQMRSWFSVDDRLDDIQILIS